MTQQAPRILALDLGKVLGFADGAVDGAPMAGSVPLGRSSDDLIDRVIALEKWLTDRLAFRPDILAIEANLSLRAMKWEADAKSAFLLMGTAEKVARQCGVNNVVTDINAQDARVHFLGKARFLVTGDGKRANAHKAQELGWEFTGLDAADALALWDATFARRFPNWYRRSHQFPQTGRLPSTFRPSMGKKDPRPKPDGPLFKSLSPQP